MKLFQRKNTNKSAADNEKTSLLPPTNKDAHKDAHKISLMIKHMEKYVPYGPIDKQTKRDIINDLTMLDLQNKPIKHVEKIYNRTRIAADKSPGYKEFGICKLLLFRKIVMDVKLEMEYGGEYVL